MYTRSDAYVRKFSSWTILGLLTISALLAFLPISPVHGSTGHPVLGTVTNNTTLVGFVQGTTAVNVIAGSDAASNDLVVTFANHFAICFNGCGVASTVFSGSQFYLYLSKDGLAQISSGDLKYTTVFNVADLQSATSVTKSVQANGTFYLGTVGGAQLLSGPLPTKITADFKYIKIYDGSTTSVAVSAQTVTIHPGITVLYGKTATGSAGVGVTVSGGGFASAAKIAINYTYLYRTWGGVLSTKNGSWITTGITNHGGWFSQSSTMVDVKQVVNPPTIGNIYTTVITFTAVNATKLSKPFTFGPGDAHFTVSNRVFKQVSSYYGASKTVSTGTYGNGTATGFAPRVPVLNVYITGTLGIEGNFTNAGSTITVTIGSATKTVASDAVSGKYVANITIPNLPKGTATVTVSDNGVVYSFLINVLPTLVLKPTSGPIGTHVTVTAYGFPAKNKVWIYWQCISFVANCFPLGTGGTDYNYVNATTDTTGYFTGAVFTVPKTFGGAHGVWAVANSTTTFPGHTKAAVTIGGVATSSATFTVTPLLILNVTTVNSNTKGWIKASGTGFDPNAAYNVNLDNAQFSPATDLSDLSAVPGALVPAANGDLNLTFSATGFRPGWHIVSFYSADSYDALGAFAPAVWAYFNVTTNGDYIVAQFSSLTSTVNSLKTTINNLQTSMNTLTNSVGSIASNVDTILTNTNGLSATLGTMGTKIDSLNSALNTASGSITSISGKLDSITSTVNSIQSALSSSGSVGSAISSMQSQVKSTQDAVSSASTYVLVVAVLAAITLVLELAILVRKLS